MSKRYPGGILRKTPQTPTQTSAQGVWDMASVTQAVKENTWPIAGVPDPISKSLRFRSSASAYLNRTFGTPTSTTTWSLSFWLKRGNLTANAQVFSAGGDFIYFGGGTFVIKAVSGAVLETTQVFRDPSAWYHFLVVADTSNATANNRVRLYVNGTEVTAFSSRTNPSLSAATIFNASSSNNRIGGTGSIEFYDGYLAEVNFVDGQALTPSSFGSTNDQTGVWQPIAYTGTYGTNGFYLPFSNTASTTTLGYDYSGNSNNWTTNNISLTSGSTYDSMVDVPTQWIPYNTAGDTGALFRGNYAVLNPLNKASNITITNGNLLATNAVGAIENVRSTMPTAGTLSYWEYTATTVGSSLRMEFGGILSSYNQSVSNTSYLAATGPTGTFGAFWNSGLTLYVNGSSVFTNGSANIVANDVIQFAHDSSTGKLWLGLNGTWYNSGNPAAGTGNVATLTAETVFPAMMMNGGGGTNAASANFGQRPFSYTPPSGFKTLCTTNLSTPTIGATASTTANKYFNPVLYTGTGSSPLSISGVNFQPDFVWIKDRTGANNHCLFDAVRGVQLLVNSNTTSAEQTFSTSLISFNSDGFTLGNYGNVNLNSSSNYVSWNWKANGSGVTNTAGTITSTVSANTTAGFSIVTYTGNGTSGNPGVSIGHGLGVKPSMVIGKRRNSTSDWYVWHSGLSNPVYYLKLNATSSEFTGGTTVSPFGVGGAGFDSTVFYVSNNSDSLNVSTGTYVAYCFAPIAGYSAFGSYVGNGVADGPFIFTGFRPRYFILKNITSAQSWSVQDTSRSPYNVSSAVLLPNSSSAELTGTDFIDIVSNGFKIRHSSSGNNNNNGDTYIYMAFAENPFKYALAR